MKVAAGILPGSAMAFVASGEARNPGKIAGAWTTLHTSPVGPFREFLVFAEGGGLTETNTLLHTNSNLGLFAQLGLPLPLSINASDGMGNWKPAGHDRFDVTFRKLLFDGAGTHIGEFRVAGRVRLQGEQLVAEWHRIYIATTAGDIFELGTATSEGARIG